VGTDCRVAEDMDYLAEERLGMNLRRGEEGEREEEEKKRERGGRSCTGEEEGLRRRIGEKPC